MSTTIQSDVLTPEQAAEYLGIAKQTLAVWRSKGRYGLRFTKVGRRVRYRKADLDAFLEGRTVTNTGEAESL